ncbi:MAG TPA: NAD(P)H-binding protein, partial [Stellaceae bacterium]|nr:NAD(P)H-binding protein [Stellaceae bacterium]
MNTLPNEYQAPAQTTAPGIALVLGATGGVGGAVARALLARGWRVRALTRNPRKALSTTRLDAVAWIAGDAMNAANVAAAARGATILFHGVNPPRYRNWRGLALPMLAHSIAAAKAAGARLIFPGNLYNYGPDSWPVIDVDAPQHPRTRKGAIRVEMEQMLSDAARAGLRVLIVRAGDFFGASAPASWFQNAMVTPGKRLRAVTYPGAPEAGHAWAYLPDLAETIARLA